MGLADPSSVCRQVRTCPPAVLPAPSCRVRLTLSSGSFPGLLLVSMFSQVVPRYLLCTEILPSQFPPGGQLTSTPPQGHDIP